MLLTKRVMHASLVVSVKHEVPGVGVLLWGRALAIPVPDMDNENGSDAALYESENIVSYCSTGY